MEANFFMFCLSNGNDKNKIQFITNKCFLAAWINKGTTMISFKMIYNCGG